MDRRASETHRLRESERERGTSSTPGPMIIIVVVWTLERAVASAVGPSPVVVMLRLHLYSLFVVFSSSASVSFVLDSHIGPGLLCCGGPGGPVCPQPLQQRTGLDCT